jgi:hypothetical protein
MWRSWDLQGCKSRKHKHKLLALDADVDQDSGCTLTIAGQCFFWKPGVTSYIHELPGLPLWRVAFQVGIAFVVCNVRNPSVAELILRLWKQKQ